MTTTVDKIKVLKLATGEEIIGMVEEDEYNVNVSHPHFLRVMATEGGQHQIAMFPTLQFGDDKTKVLQIRKEFVMYTYKPVEDLLEQFNSRFGSGLVIPTFKSILNG